MNTEIDSSIIIGRGCDAVSLHGDVTHVESGHPPGEPDSELPGMPHD